MLSKLSFHLSKNLPDNEEGCENDNEIHILLGSDFYWNFIGGDSIRLNGKLVILNSKFGYILSGPIETI